MICTKELSVDQTHVTANSLRITNKQTFRFFYLFMRTLPINIKWEKKNTYHLDNPGFSIARFRVVSTTPQLDKYNKATDAFPLSSSNCDYVQDYSPSVQSDRKEVLHVPARLHKTFTKILQKHQKTASPLHFNLKKISESSTIKKKKVNSIVSTPRNKLRRLKSNTYYNIFL